MRPPPLGIRAAAAVLGLGASACGGGTDLVIGSKNFSEQDLLGELVAHWIERTTDLTVGRRLHLGGTFIAHRALAAGEIDLYVEYTGTALTAILERPPGSAPDEVYRTVRGLYSDSLDLEWTEPLGFENTFAILVRRATADSLDLTTVSGAAPHSSDWVPGFGYEFVEREDGLAGLRDLYRLEFAEAPKLMDLGLIYRALAGGQIDLTAGNSTEGQIAALDLVWLEDDLGYFPPYFAAPVVRDATLRRFPELRASLRALGGRLDTEAMRTLNRAVDVDGRPFADVAREWVERELEQEPPEGLLGPDLAPG